MKKTYIAPDTEILRLNAMQNMLVAGSVEGLGGDSTDMGLSLADEGEEEENADTKENAFEENPWEQPVSDNYWE